MPSRDGCAAATAKCIQALPEHLWALLMRRIEQARRISAKVKGEIRSANRTRILSLGGGVAMGWLRRYPPSLPCFAFDVCRAAKGRTSACV